MKPDHVLGVIACTCCLIIAASVWVFVSVAAGLVEEYSPQSVISAQSQEIVLAP